MTYDTYSYYLCSQKIERYFTTRKYNIKTFRTFSRDYLNIPGTKLVEKYGLRESLLNSKLVFKDEELFELKTMMVDLLDFIDKNGKNYVWYKSRFVLFNTEVYNLRYTDPDRNDKIIGKFEIRTRFKKIIGKYIESLINDENDDRTEFGY